MKRYLDTSVWIASFLQSHPKHKQCANLIKKSFKQKVMLVTSTHCLAELYSVLTKLPVPYKLQPDQVLQLLQQDVIKKTTIEPLNVSDYISIIEQSAKLKLTSGAIFDGLHVQSAIQSGSSEIYTLNIKDFIRFEIPEKVVLLEL